MAISNTTKITVVSTNNGNIHPMAHVSASDLLIRRRDYKNRHKLNGTMHNVKGYLFVGRDPVSGRFTKLN